MSQEKLKSLPVNNKNEPAKHQLIRTLAKLESLNKMMQKCMPDDADLDMYIIENGLSVQWDIIVEMIDQVEACCHE